MKREIRYRVKRPGVLGRPAIKNTTKVKIVDHESLHPAEKLAFDQGWDSTRTLLDDPKYTTKELSKSFELGRTKKLRIEESYNDKVARLQRIKNLKAKKPIKSKSQVKAELRARIQKLVEANKPKV
jgi:hypothetical protein